MPKTIFKQTVPFNAGDIGDHYVNVDKAMVALVNEIKTRFPSVKIVYAYLNPDRLAFIEYTIILKGDLTATQGSITKKVPGYICISAIKFGERSLECFDLCRRDGHLDKFFDALFEQVFQLNETIFRSLIKDELKLSWNKDSDKYWKKPENAEKLTSKISDLSSMNYTLFLRNK